MYYSFMASKESLDFFVSLGSQIASFRRELDLTQDQLAQMIGIKQQALASYESGRRKIPLPTLLDLAKVLHVTMEDLLPTNTQITSRRGPVPRVLLQLERIKALSEDKQKILFSLLDSWLQDPANKP